MTPLIGSALISLGTSLVDRLFPDKAKADEAKIQLIAMVQNGELQELAARTGIIQAEAASEHWLAATWRPILMLTFGMLIVARWFGWSAPNLSEAEYLKLWSIVELGIGGYVIGRSAEKIVPQIADAFGKRQ